MQDNEYIKVKTNKPDRLGDEAPELKDYLIVFGAVALLIAFGWVSWYKFGWFH